MNPEKPSREEIEAKLTALLLGELPAEEAQLLRWAVSQDAALAQMHDRLKATIGFVNEVATHPAETIPAQTAPLKLSGEKREKLLAHFKTVQPIVFLPPLPKRREISPLLMMASAVALIAVLSAMLLPALSKAKSKAQRITMLSGKIEASSTQSDIDQNSPVTAAPSALTPHALPGGDSAEIAGVVNNAPSQPQMAVDQRVSAREARIQNDKPTASSGDAWKKQTTIVLPASGAVGDDLAVASPAQSDFFNSGSHNSEPNVLPAGNANQNNFGLTPAPIPAQNDFFGNYLDAKQVDNGQTVALNRRSGGNGGGGGFQERLGAVETDAISGRQTQMRGTDIKTVVTGFAFDLGDKGVAVNLNGNALPASAAENKDAFFATGLTRDDVSGLRNLYAANNVQNEPVDQSRFDGKTDAKADADKLPMLGDAPKLGVLFQSQSRLVNQGDEIAPNTAAPYPVSGDVNTTKLSKSGNNTLALNSMNSFSGDANEVIVSPYSDLTSGLRNNVPAKDENGKLALNDGSVQQGSVDQFRGAIRQANVAIAPLPGRGVFAETSPASASTVAPAPSAIQPSSPAPVTTAPGFIDRSLQLGVDVYAGQQAESQPSAAASPVVMNQVASEQLQSKEIPLKYANPSAMKLSIQDSLTDGRSKVAVDPSRGTLAILGTAQEIQSAENIVRQLDTPTKQGIIESRLILNAPTNSVATDEDRQIQKALSPAPIPTPEILTRENAFSTFSLNVSDVSFKLAAASLEKGQLPDAASIRSEEFINAFDYRDPEPAAGVPVAFVAERARDPFAHNRDLLRFSLKTAAAGREPGRPLNLVLLLDNSGSMERADRVAIIHEALKVLASQLQPQDTLSIVTFARTPRLWVDGAHGDQAGTAVNQVSDLTPEGGTNLEEAMNLAYATARRHYLAKGANRVVLLTDGAANLGNVDPEALKQKVESFRKQGIALDCFGIGWEGYNDDLLEVLSSNGDGRYGFINSPEAATTEFAAQLAGALHVAAQDVKVQVEFNPGRVTSWRQIGYAKHQLTKQQFRDNTVDAAEIAAQEAGNALYTVEVNPAGTGPVATVRVRYKVPGTGEYREQAWEVPFEGNAPALEQSSSAMRLAATASAFSEWLASSPFAQEVTTDQLLNYLNGVPAIYGADARPKQLETMIREAKSLSGK